MSAIIPRRRSSCPSVTRDRLPAGLGPGEIDAAVRERTQAGEAIYELDVERSTSSSPT